jgi:hypothetical protein
MFERTIQLLACEFHVSTDAPALVARLDEVRPTAFQNYPPRRRHHLRMIRAANAWHVSEDAEPIQVLDNVEEAVRFVESRVHELALAALAEYTRLHAGCGTWHGRRFLLIGDKGAGKTTLMARLLIEGCAVEGDEMVLLRQGEVTPYPRRFGIRLFTLSLVPQLGALVPHLLDRSDANDPGGFHVLAFDPSQLGFEWRITSGPVDVLFWLEPRRDGPSALAASPGHVMAQRVMLQSAPPERGSSDWVREIAELVKGAATFDLTVGDLDSAVVVVRQCLTRL